MPGISYNQSPFAPGPGGGGAWGGSPGFGGQQNQQYPGQGGYNPQAGDVNTQSPMYGHMMGMMPKDLQWNQQQGGPGQQGGSMYYNPFTGEREFERTPGMGFQSHMNSPGGNLAKWTDPTTGDVYMDPSFMMNQFDIGGGVGNVGIGNLEYQGYEGQYEGPAPWDQMMANAGAVTDTDAVIESYRPLMEEEIGRGFADAGARMGQSGFAMSTPYANELGQVERSALDDFTRTALGYKYGAAESQAGREMEAQLANAANNLQMQTALSGQQHQGAMQNQLLDFYSQTGINDFNLAQGGMQLQADLANQQAGMQNNQFMQGIMAQLMGGML